MTMSVTTMNGVNASKGMQGSSPTTTPTFAGNGVPITGPLVGMTGGTTQASAPVGSSYTKGAGMNPLLAGAMHDGNYQKSAQTGGAIGLQQSGALSGGVVPGQGVASAVPYQGASQMSQAQMQDPENAAMAGFQFAAGNDAAPSAATGAVQAPEPRANPNYSPGGSGSSGPTGALAFARQPLRPTNDSIGSGPSGAMAFANQPLRPTNTSVGSGAPAALGYAATPLRPTDTSVGAGAPEALGFATPPPPPTTQSGQINNDWMKW